VETLTAQTFQDIEKAAVRHTNEALGRGEGVKRAQLKAAMVARFPGVDPFLVDWLAWGAVEEAWTPKTMEDLQASLDDLMIEKETRA
jgi:hypothetical protein